MSPEPTGPPQEPRRSRTDPIRRSVAQLSELLLPKQCVSCQRWGTWFCEACRPRIDSLLSREVRVPGPVRSGLLVRSALPYRGVGGEVVRSHKQRGIRALIPVLAGWLAGAVLDLVGSTGRIGLVPVPDSARARRTRGRSAWLEVCRSAVMLLGSGFELLPILRWRVRTRPQKRLPRSLRSENVHLRVALRRSGIPVTVSGQSAAAGAGPGQIILLDDVITTGATLAECARALGDRGIVCGQAATVCAAAAG